MFYSQIIHHIRQISNLKNKKNFIFQHCYRKNIICTMLLDCCILKITSQEYSVGSMKIILQWTLIFLKRSTLLQLKYLFLFLTVIYIFDSMHSYVTLVRSHSYVTICEIYSTINKIIEIKFRANELE